MRLFSKTKTKGKEAWDQRTHTDPETLEKFEFSFFFENCSSLEIYLLLRETR
jgi:hypothetical protein